ncbi:hypothetical protein [Ruminococcus sp.]|uniref:hypothetical protein n=1 Tax=Ruminococcus sp. TaxID=41978 RepID=UPI0025EF9C91|nr:hypothetical protein [Ruminococcus sp.]
MARYIEAVNAAEIISVKLGITLSELLDVMAAVPTADVQPVKRGTWENTNTPNQLRCSNCEIIHFIAQYPYGEINYCPNCGARMDGVANG